MANHDILLVDNELLSRELLTNYLKHSGFAVQVAADSGGAVKTISRNRFSLAIISSGVGVKEVVGLIARIHSRQKLSLVYLLVPQTGAFDADRLGEIGAYDIIVKPFRLEDVKLKMRHALELLALRNQAREYSEKLLKLESRLERYEAAKECVEIPDISSTEPPQNDRNPDPGAEGKKTGQASRIPARLGEKEYRKQQRNKENGIETIEQIRRLDELRKAGILTEDEFKKKKKELLNRI
ncbi:MAG: response regulator [Candidatus Glassbacteria bacterium]|nr:response regulator [Candidatus Glassbacteria bacterium]